MKTYYALAVAILFASSFAGCLDASAQPTFNLSSPAFADGGLLGQQFTCDGAGVSPSLSWQNAPAGTTSFAVTMHHYPPAAAEKHVYMVVYDLTLSTDHLEQGTTLGTWGVNTVNRKMVYTPPCSQGLGRKDYILTVYALSLAPVFTTLKTEITMDAFLAAIKSVTLATATMTVGYARP